MNRSEMVFPSYIYRGRFSPAVSRKLNQQLAKEIATLERIDEQGRRWSRANYVGGYSSYASLTRLHHTSPYFGELEERLKSHVAKFVRTLKWDLMGRKLAMTTCWANSMGKGTHHTLHTHPLSVLSGVYYVTVPAGSSAFKIEDPRLPLFMAAPPRKPTAPPREQNYMLIKPQPGEFILFESWMRHEVPPHRGTQRRLSVSFNFEF